MTDRELLELAANAVGCELDYSIHQDAKAFYHPDRHALALAGGGWFAPLTDDGDAFRLAVRLNLNVFSVGGFAYAMLAEGDEFDEAKVPHEGDPYAATRRAIVKAAAAIAQGANQ